MASRIYAILFLVLIIPLLSYGQPDVLPSDEMEVIKDFEVQLGDSKRLEVLPNLPIVDTTSKVVSYAIKPKLLELDYVAPEIRPLKLKSSTPIEVYNFYAKAGFGYPLTPYAELGYAKDTDRFGVAADALYHSTNNDRNLDFQRFSTLDLNAKATHHSQGGFGVGGSLGYTWDRAFFYGYDHEQFDYSRDSTLQQLNEIRAGLHFKNEARTQGDINYHLLADFYTLSDRFETNEIGIDANAMLAKYIYSKHYLGIDINNQYLINTDTSTYKNNIVSLNPYFKYNGNSWSAKAGLNYTYSDDHYFFPNVELNLVLQALDLSIYAGWDGELRQNSFRHLTNTNIYIVSAPVLQNTSVQNIFAGVKGKIKKINYNAELGYKIIEGLPLFLNDYAADNRRFTVLYDNANVINIHVGINTAFLDNLDFFASLDYNVYDLENIPKAWHLPDIETNIGAKYYLFDDKLTLKTELFFVGGISYLDNSLTEKNLDPIFDISLGADYQITKNFGIFLDLNNVTNSNYQRYFRYDSFGFNVLGGLTLKF